MANRKGQRAEESETDSSSVFESKTTDIPVHSFPVDAVVDLLMDALGGPAGAIMEEHPDFE